MKTKIFAAVAALFLLSFFSCVTNNWAGIYTGVIPSASGEGINVSITLAADKTYKVEYRYVGKSDDVFTGSGTFNFNPEGDTIILDSKEKGDFPAYYKLVKNTLIQLDTAGNIITGELSDDYILRKQR